MRIGKVSENVLKRSILKQIKNRCEEIEKGAGIGEDCALFTFKNMESTVTCVTPTFSLGLQGEMKCAIIKGTNSLASSGAIPIGILLTIFLPKESEEAFLKSWMKEAEETCQALGIQIAGGHTEVSEAVNKPVASITTIGKIEADSFLTTKGAKAGWDIVITKWVGLEGTYLLAENHRDELLTRYPMPLIEEARSFEQYLSVAKEARIAVKEGECVMHDASNGGIFAALWELAQGSGVGLEVDLKKIPIRQETIEICEFYGKNPYELTSGGSLVIALEDGSELVEKLLEQGIFARIVGKTMNNNDKVVINDEERRFLELPGSDEILKEQLS